MDDSDARTLWCGNLSSEVTEDLLYELFLQAGPLERVCIPKNPNGCGNRSYGFVTFKHAESVSYSVDLMQGVKLFDRFLNIRGRTSNQNNSNCSPNVVGGGSQSSSESMSRRPSTELIVLDSDNGSPSSSSRHCGPPATPDFRRHHSFDDSSMYFRSPPQFMPQLFQGQLIAPAPFILDFQQNLNNHHHRRHQQQQQHSNVLQDPWKQPEDDGGQQQRHHAHHRHQHHIDRQNSLPYGGHPYRRF